MARPTWDEYFMKIAGLVAERSTCLRRKVGAIIVKDKRIVATGYNGAPKGLEHCLDIGCLRDDLGIPSGERHELCRGAHAEQNAIIQAAGGGTGIAGATMYCTDSPCAACTKMIINAGIKRLVLGKRYPDRLGERLIDEAGIETVFLAPQPHGPDAED